MTTVILLGILVVGLSLAVLWRGPRSVTKVLLSPDRLITAHLPDANYVDNYRAESSSRCILRIDSVEAVAPQKGELVACSKREVVYRGLAPGLVFYISYTLFDADGTSGLELATIVHIKTWKGRLYFFFVRPIHRIGLPWLTHYTLRRTAVTQ